MDSIQGVKNKAFVNALDCMIPNEGETITARGGLGNQIIFQSRKESGVYYRRNNENEEWEEYDIHEFMLNFISSTTEEVQNETHEKPKHPEPRYIYENLTGTKKEHNLYIKIGKWFRKLFNYKGD